MKKSFQPKDGPQSALPTGTHTSSAAAPMETSAPVTNRIIRMPGLQQMYPVGRTTIYELIKAGKLPRPIALSKRARGWVLAEVEECIVKLKTEARDE